MLHFNDTLDLRQKLNDYETLETLRKGARVVARDFDSEQVRTAFLFVLSCDPVECTDCSQN